MVRVPIAPLVTVMALAVKLLEALLSVKVISDVCPLLRLGLSLVMTTVGASVSTVMVVTDEAELLLPCKSVKTFAGTEIVPSAVELAAGVKTAV